MITKKYYKLVKVSYADSDYFRVTNVDTTAGTLTINAGNNLGCNIEYSTDGVNWTTADSNAPFSLVVPAGMNVYMRGTNSNLAGKTINMNANHNVGGNVYSLLDKVNYASRTDSVNSTEFENLFSNNTHIISAGDMNFGHVTTLKWNCYHYMFRNCTSLITPPEIPEPVSLAQGPYDSMFSGCTALTSSPELKATNLSPNCYQNMFSGCTSLNKVTCLATDISANMCTYSWLYGVAANGTFYKKAGVNWTTGTSGIPNGWTVVDA